MCLSDLLALGGGGNYALCLDEDVKLPSTLYSFKDSGPHGNGRYSEHMLPEVEMKDFKKGAQWFSMKPQHAVMVMADNLYYSKFRDHCQAWKHLSQRLGKSIRIQ